MTSARYLQNAWHLVITENIPQVSKTKIHVPAWGYKATHKHTICTTFLNTVAQSTHSECYFTIGSEWCHKLTWLTDSLEHETHWFTRLHYMNLVIKESHSKIRFDSLIYLNSLYLYSDSLQIDQNQSGTHWVTGLSIAIAITIINLLNGKTTIWT